MLPNLQAAQLSQRPGVSQEVAPLEELVLRQVPVGVHLQVDELHVLHGREVH